MTTLTIETEDATGTLKSGLRTNWVSGTDDSGDVKFELDTGAGLGNPALSLHVTFSDGTRVIEIVDVRQLTTDWVKALVKKHSEG